MNWARLTSPDAAVPVPVEGSEFLMEIDTCIPALGNGSNPLVTGNHSRAGHQQDGGNITVNEEGSHLNGRRPSPAVTSFRAPPR